MQNFENAHYDALDAQLDGLDPSLLQTETLADQAADDLSKFPDDLAESARRDLQEARAEALQGVSNQKETTQESVGEVKGQNLDRELVLSINEKFADISLEQRQLFQLAIVESGNNNPEYIAMLQKEISNNPEDILDYFEEEGVPDRKTFVYFNEEFELFSEVQQTKDNNEDTKSKMTSYSSKLKKLGAPVLPEVFDALESGNVEALKLALGDGSPGTELYKLGVFFKEQGEEEYKNFKESIIAMDQDFESIFITFENNYALDHPEAPIKPSDSIIAGSIPEHSTEDTNDGSLDVRTYVSADGSKTEIDTSVFPPKREVSLSGSEYRLETETPMTKDIQTISTEYELAHNELTPKVNSVSKLIKIMETIGNSTVLKLDDVKNTLINKVMTYTFRSQNPEVVNAIESADSMMSLQDLATTGIIAQLKQQWEDELDTAEREYKQNLADQVDSYRDMLAQKDIQAKKVLKLLKDTGFDLLPQNITDQIISEIESGQLILDLGTTFDPTNVDIVNGDFGEPKTLEGSNDQFVRNLTKFMNKLIGLKPDGTDTDGNLVGLSEEAYLIGNAPHTPEEIRNMIMQAGIISEAGGFNLERARANLKKPLSEFETSEPSIS